MAREWLTDKDSGNSKNAWKNFVKDRQDLKKIIDEAKATDSELYQHLQNDPARYVEVMTHKYDGTKKPKDYPREITKIVKVEKPQKPKPKPIPLKPKPQHLIPDDEGIMFDPDDPLKDLYGIKVIINNE